MKSIVLDGKELSDKQQFHRIIKQKLSLPEYYGENLDALWDCLSGWIELPMKITWINFAESKKNLGDFAEEIVDIFREAQEELKGFSFEIKP